MTNKINSGASDFTIVVMDKDDYISNQLLHNELIAILTPSYINPFPIFDRELKHSNKLYLAIHDKKVIGFFMVTWETLNYQDQKIPAVFLGLSAICQQLKNTGIIRNLYCKFIEDAQQWENKHKQRLLLRFTSATPSSLYAVHLLFDEVYPKMDGTYTSEAEAIATSIRLQAYPSINSNHPFVLKAVAKDTNYSEDEKKRINSITKKYNYNFFANLGIDETKQDRLLGICRVPMKLNVSANQQNFNDLKLTPESSTTPRLYAKL